MKDRSCLLLFTIFLTLSIIHFNWAAGNEGGLRSAIPTDGNGNAVLSPTLADTLIVGFGLLLFALFYISQTKYISIRLPRWINLILGWFIPVIFLLRAIGDFQYVGFFKEIKTTDFAYMDTLLYSPLCLAVSILGFVAIKTKNKG